MQSKTRNSVRTIVQVGMLVALAVVIRNFSLMIAIEGVPGLRISFGEVFTRMAAVLFGPVYGGMASGLLDVIGYLLAGGAFGPYIPWLTADAVLGGLMIGFLWILAGKTDSDKAGRRYLIVFSAIGALGGIFQMILSFLPGSSLTHWLLQLKNKDGISVFPMLPIALMIVAVAGFILYLVNILLKKLTRKLGIQDGFMKVLMVIGIPGLIVSTLDSVALSAVYHVHFLIMWIPRFSVQIVMLVIHAYIITYLITVYKKYLAKT